MFEPRALHNEICAAEAFCLGRNERTGVCFMQRCVFEQGQPDRRCPLHQRMERVEVQKVSVLAGRTQAQHIFQWLRVLAFGR